jgi:hypothetical protein
MQVAGGFNKKIRWGRSFELKQDREGQIWNLLFRERMAKGNVGALYTQKGWFTRGEVRYSYLAFHPFSQLLSRNLGFPSNVYTHRTTYSWGQVMVSSGSGIAIFRITAMTHASVRRNSMAIFWRTAHNVVVAVMVATTFVVLPFVTGRIKQLPLSCDGRRDARPVETVLKNTRQSHVIFHVSVTWLSVKRSRKRI